MSYTRSIYILGFLTSLQLAAMGFFFSPFLIHRGINEEWVGVVMALGNFFGIAALGLTPLLMAALRNYTLYLIMSLLLGGLFLTLPFLTTPFALTLAAIAYAVSSLIIMFSQDMFLEATSSSEEATGSVRGLYMSLASLAYILSPLIGGFLVAGALYSNLFFTLAGSMLVVCVAAALWLRGAPEGVYTPFSLWKTTELIKRNKDIRSIFLAQFMLRIFYAAMTVYMPVYLTYHLGFSLFEMGIITSIAMVPFVLVEFPLGILADRFYGEKEILIFSTVWLGVCAVAFSLFTTPSFLLWAVLMFISRIGAAGVEIMTESYFFKHTKGADSDTVSAFRILFPLAYITGPLIGSLALVFIDMQYIFAYLGLTILIFGVYAATQITDTR